MTAARVIVGIALIGVLGIACTGKPDTSLVEYQSIRPSKYFSPEYSGPERATFAALQSEQEWRQLWAEIEPRMAREMTHQEPHPLPAIDFGRHTLIVAAMGMRPTGGYSVGFHSVGESPTQIVVVVTEKYPGKGCVVTAAITHPIALALVPRTTKQVVFDVRDSEVRCGS